jgi:hypothetical protein
VGDRLNGASRLEPSDAHPNGDELHPRADSAVFIARQADGGWYFVCNGNYLTSAKTGNRLYWNAAPNEYSIWNLEETGTDDLVYIVNLNAAYYGKAQALEYYNGAFTSYSKTTADAFCFRVYAVPDHVWSEPTVTLPATCETAGSAYDTCILCGETAPAEQPALGHSWTDWTVTKQPSCIEEGSADPHLYATAATRRRSRLPKNRIRTTAAAIAKTAAPI